MPSPPALISGFADNPAFEPSFGVRNAVFHPKHTHADKAKFVSGEDVKCHQYTPDSLLQDFGANKIEGTLYMQAYHMCVIACSVCAMDSGTVDVVIARSPIAAPLCMALCNFLIAICAPCAHVCMHKSRGYSVTAGDMQSVRLAQTSVHCIHNMSPCIPRLDTDACCEQGRCSMLCGRR